MREAALEWTEHALRHLDHACNYVAFTNGNSIAEQAERRILASVQQLTAFPNSGRPGRVKNTRELVISKTPFIAAYTLNKNRIVILALYHGAQRWPDEL